MRCGRYVVDVDVVALNLLEENISRHSSCHLYDTRYVLQSFLQSTIKLCMFLMMLCLMSKIKEMVNWEICR